MSCVASTENRSITRSPGSDPTSNRLVSLIPSSENTTGSRLVSTVGTTPNTKPRSSTRITHVSGQSRTRSLSSKTTMAKAQILGIDTLSISGTSGRSNSVPCGSKR